MDNEIKAMTEEARAKSKVPIWHKYALTVNEAAAYFHIGGNNLRKLIAMDREAPYLLRVGSKFMFKREKFAEYLDGLNNVAV